MKFILEENSFTWYTNGISSIKVYAGEEIPDGYWPGRTFKSNPWNKGLTKETDNRVKQNSEKTRQTRLDNDSYKSWNTGLTKETDSRLAAASQRLSTNRKSEIVQTWNKGIPATDAQKQKQSAAMQGKEPWNKGLTKETDTRVNSTANKLIGHKCFVTNWEKAKEKEYLTKKLNHSFNTSKPESELLLKLQNTYGIENVVSQYQDERYKNPETGRKYNCDFYIKSLDLFIELNYAWFHGEHPFNEDSIKDLETLNNWQLKATSLQENNSYLYAIKIWTENDPLKLSVFRKNKLNFLIIYPNGLVIDK